MPERDGYIPGVPCWVDTSQPDPEVAVDFYSGLFGWEFEDVMPPESEGKYFIARIRGGDVAAIGSIPEGAPPMEMWNTYVWVESADQTVSKVLGAGGTGQLANAAFAGGVLAAGGFAILASVHLALAESASHARTIGATQTLNVLDGNDFIPAVAGVALLVFAAGASAIRHGGLPKWLGWVGIVIGIVAFTPAGFFAFLAGGLWVLVTSVLLARSRSTAGPVVP